MFSTLSILIFIWSLPVAFLTASVFCNTLRCYDNQPPLQKPRLSDGWRLSPALQHSEFRYQALKY